MERRARASRGRVLDQIALQPLEGAPGRRLFEGRVEPVKKAHVFHHTAAPCTRTMGRRRCTARSTLDLAALVEMPRVVAISSNGMSRK